MSMESTLQRISKYSLYEIKKYGEEVEAQSVDASIRHILAEFKRLREKD